MLAAVALQLQRTQSDAVRFLIRQAADDSTRDPLVAQSASDIVAPAQSELDQVDGARKAGPEYGTAG